MRGSMSSAVVLPGTKAPRKFTISCFPRMGAEELVKAEGRCVRSVAGKWRTRPPGSVKEGSVDKRW